MHSRLAHKAFFAKSEGEAGLDLSAATFMLNSLEQGKNLIIALHKNVMLMSDVLGAEVFKLSDGEIQDVNNIIDVPSAHY